MPLMLYTKRYMSNDARLDEEIATQRRAGVLQLQYTDTSQIKDKQLFRDILTNDELYKLRGIPIESYKGNLHFGITTTTSQQTIEQLQQRFTDVRSRFSIISDAGYRESM